MKTHRHKLTAILLTGMGCTPFLFGAAESEVEKHVFVEYTAEADVDAKTEMESVTFLGVEVREVDPVLIDHLDLEEGIGLVVEMVKEDSPASRAGLRENDILVRLRDQLLITPRQLSVLVRREADGAKVPFEILRKGKRSKIQAVLEQREIPVHKTFHWFGGGVMPHGDFPFPGPDSEQIERIIRKEIKTSGAPHVVVESGLIQKAPGESRLIHIDPHRNMVFSNDEGTVEMVIGGTTSSLVVKNPDGTVIYDGSADADGLPDEIRDRMADLDVTLEVDLEDLPEPPEVDIVGMSREPTI